MSVRPFPEMRDLVFRHHHHDLGAFPPELLLAIFWHESRFQNVAQIHGAGAVVGGHGMGFGQVERKVIGMIRDQLGISYPVGPLTDAQSVEVTGLTLHLHLTRPAKTSVERALHAYATGHRPTGARWSPGPTVSGWLQCARELWFLRAEALPGAYAGRAAVGRIWAALRCTVPSSNDFELSLTLPMPAGAP